MRTTASLIGITAFALAGCQGGDEATSVARETTTRVVTTTAPPEPVLLTAEDRLLRWISSCEIRQITFTHESVALIKFGQGRTVGLRIDESAEERIQAAAFQQRCPDRKGKHIIVGIE